MCSAPQPPSRASSRGHVRLQGVTGPRGALLRGPWNRRDIPVRRRRSGPTHGDGPGRSDHAVERRDGEGGPASRAPSAVTVATPPSMLLRRSAAWAASSVLPSERLRAAIAPEVASTARRSLRHCRRARPSPAPHRDTATASGVVPERHASDAARPLGSGHPAAAMHQHPACPHAARSRMTRRRSTLPSKPMPGRSGRVTWPSSTRTVSGKPPYGWNRSG